MGNIIEEALTKSTNQTIYGQKKIQGSINASELIVNGLINDVNLIELIDQQLKKNKPLQTIRTRTIFQNSLHIRGNLTVGGTYDAAEMKNFYTSYSNVLPVAEKMERSLEAAEEIRTALQSISFTILFQIFRRVCHRVVAFIFLKLTKWHTCLKQ